MNTKRPFADKPGTSLAPPPMACVSCSIRGSDASQATSSLLLSLFFKDSGQATIRRDVVEQKRCEHSRRGLRGNELPAPGLGP